MKKIQLLLVLSSLDRYEFEKLGEMVYSPYFNKSKKCQELFELLKPFYPEFDDPSLTKESLFFQLYPEKEKMTSTINIKLSQLQDLAEEHLIQQALSDRFLLKKHLLLKTHLEKGLFKRFESQYKETKDRFTNIKKRNSLNFLEQYLIESDYRNFRRNLKGRDSTSSPTTLSYYLDSYYWIQKLKIECEIETHFDISSSEKRNVNELLELSQNKEKDLLLLNEDVQKDHLCLLFRNLLRCIQQPQNEEIFDEFLTLFLTTDAREVDKREYNEFFIHSINYCIDKIIEGKDEYRNKLFDLYKLVVDFELIYENGYLNLSRVKNIVSCAAQVGELEWAISFLKAYKGTIHPEQGNSAYHFYLATIYFYKQQFDHTILELNLIETDLDKFYFLDRITLLLRCYYEGKSPIAFENNCKTFRANIKRNKKLTTKEKRSYGAFARLAFFIHQYREGFSKKTKSQLQELVHNANPISHKQWLLEKLNELK